ncbi:radical SAM protein [archaeon]|jgi:MoaA/NifB/PqqE/SkfB family radical SAM enzyme|nr:radical SAM protein [Candidatus Woesearchaeota archaeon]MBT4351691.1 radical SAM protein [archaeon]MBT4647513.1 radical SAM protein [archaeon]MBT6821990.1 radical SAM protein [archaeon]MBT7391518.1 radical SAM protein [archaeon]
MLKNCSIKIESGCFFKCEMCYFWKRKKGSNIYVKDFDKIFRSLAKINPNMQVSLYGGEPLMRQDIFEIIQLATNQGLKSNICTNGFLLNKKVVKKLSEAGLYDMYISLDGYKKETHDKIRGQIGSYDKIINAFEIINGIKNSFYVSPTFVILKQNIKELIDFVVWAEKYRFTKEISLQVLEQPLNTPLIEYWYRDKRYSHLWPDDIILIKTIFQKLINLKKKGKLSKLKQTTNQLKGYEKYYLFPEVFVKKQNECNVQNEYLNIYDDGDVKMCNKMEPLGNVLNDDLYELWYSFEANKIRNKMKLCKTNCMQVLTTAYKE